MKQSPIFVKTYDLLVWLLGRTGNFSKNERFRMAKRVEDSWIRCGPRPRMNSRPDTGNTLETCCAVVGTGLNRFSVSGIELIR